MRRMHLQERNEIVDVLDERWAAFLATCGSAIAPLPNDPESVRAVLARLSPDAIILTGGGDPAALTGMPDVRDQVEAIVVAWAAETCTAVIGVCRGMQVLMALDGASLIPVNGHIGTRHRINGEIEREVNSFHRFKIDKTPEQYCELAYGEDGCIECVADFDRRRFAIMWHPERERPFNPDDVSLFRFWLFGRAE